MSPRIVIAALLAVPVLLPAPAPAQNASPGSDTQLQIEARRKRLLVRPQPPIGAAVQDAERAAQEQAAAELARQENAPPRRHPQLDYDVTSGVQARTLQRTLRR